MTTFFRVSTFMFVVSCANGSSPSQQPSVSRNSLSVCELARYADYVGQFEIRSAVGAEALKSSTLRLVKPVIVNPPNESTWVLPEAVSSARGPEVTKLRALRAGDELSAQLELPPGARVGTLVTVFLSYSTVYKVWADINGQGVFFKNSQGMLENSVIYQGSNAVTELEFTSEMDRGSRLSRTGSPHCDEGKFVAAPRDSGVQSEDAGR